MKVRIEHQVNNNDKGKPTTPAKPCSVPQTAHIQAPYSALD